MRNLSQEEIKALKKKLEQKQAKLRCKEIAHSNICEEKLG